MVISDLLTGITILEKLGGVLGRFRRKPETAADRFLTLFKAHGVHSNQIPRFFGHGLTLVDVQSEGKLLKALTDDLLKAAADLFGVNLAWLEGASEEVYPILNFYKDPEAFVTFIANLTEKGNPCSGRLLLGRCGKEPQNEQYDAVLVIEETIDYIDDKPIDRIHLCDHWVFNYWKCRAYLTACIAIAWKNKVYIHGQLAQRASLTKFAEGLMLLSELPSVTQMNLGELRHPEDMATRPDVFLTGLAERDGKAGEIEGLELWLKLDDQGYMELSDGGKYRADFEAAMQAQKSIDD